MNPLSNTSSPEVTPVDDQVPLPGEGTTRRRRRIALVVGIVLLLVIVGLYGSSLYFLQMFRHRVEKLETTPEALGLEAESISLVSADGVPLKAWWIPAEEPEGVIILLHGMDGMDASSLLGHAHFLHEAGYAALALDMRAHGRSGGERIGLAFEEPLDVAAALDWIAAQPGLEEVDVALLGISMGGATALRTAAARPEVDAVISVSAFASIDLMVQDAMALMMDAPPAVVAVYAPFMKLAFLTSYGVWPATASPLRDIPQIPPRPILIAHGTADDQIVVDHAYLLEEAADHRVEMWIVEGAGHGIYKGDATGPEDAAYRARILAFLAEALDED